MKKIIVYLWGCMFAYPDRKHIYKKMLRDIEHDILYGINKTGFCIYASKAMDIKWAEVQMWKLPEIYWYKPEEWYDSKFWFSLDEVGTMKRVKILKEIVKHYKYE
jgi:hypothetical protein